MPDLRVGVVCYDDRMYAWQAQTIAQIGAVAGVTISAFLPRPHDAKAAFRFPSRSEAFRRVEFEPARQGADDAQPLDVVINLTGSSHRCEHGAREWKLHFADPTCPGRFEAHQGADTALVWLREFSPAGERNLGEIHLKAASSPRRNCDRVVLESTFLFARALNALRSGVAAERALPSQGPRRSWQVRAGKALARVVDKRFSRSRWTVGFVSQSLEEVIRVRALARPVWLRGLPAGRFFADPFPLPAANGTLALLAENGDGSPPYKGHLSRITFRPTGDVVSVDDALIAPEHLSFPFLFEDNGERYCLPECFQSGELRAYRDVDGIWKPDAVLLGNVAAVDPVLHHVDGVWWLFCCDRRHDDTTHLYLYSANDWRGPYTPHPLNPVKSDVRSSRPAGALIDVDGELFRPAQDCSLRYGGALSVQRITTLSRTNYAEETAFKLSPDAFGRRYCGLHTLNGRGGITVFDALERRSVFAS